MCDTVKFVLPAYSHSRQTLVTRRNTSGATRSDIRGHRHQSFPIVHWQQRQELTLCGHKQIISLLASQLSGQTPTQYNEHGNMSADVFLFIPIVSQSVLLL